MKLLQNKTQRVFPDFATPQEVRGKSFFDLHDRCFQKYLVEGLGCIAKQNRLNTLFLIPKNAFNSEFELFPNLFPTNSGPAAHTIDELTSEWRDAFCRALDAAARAISCVARTRGDALSRLYAVQHVGPGELGAHSFSTTYEQLHWHVYGLTRQLTHDCQYGELHATQEGYLKNTFRELFIRVYLELLQRSRPTCALDRRTASVILAEEPLRTDAAQHWRDEIVWVMQQWKMVWRMWAECFSDLRIDGFGRLRVRDDVDRIKRVVALIRELGLSRASARRLLWFARHIRPSRALLPADESPDWCSCHTDINGSIGITYDFDRERVSLRIAPRTFLVVERIGATDGLYYCRKERGSSLSRFDTERIQALQRELVGAFKREFTRLERDG